MLKDKILALATERSEYKNSSQSLENNIGLSNCPICKGLGMILRQEQGKTYSSYCTCVNKKISQERFAKTEIANKENYTFKNYKAIEEWQKNILRQAIDYVEHFDKGDDWFYIGGQIGAGKTHICTAILRNIGQVHNASFIYIKCDEELEKLKQMTYEEQGKYNEAMQRLKNTDLLFIDDFFRKEPTETDKAKMFDIINFRYLNNKACIFSSEKPLLSVLAIDEAVGSRIYEKAKKFNITVEKGINKNYRLKQ